MDAGYAQASITPSLDKPVYLAGFGQNRRAESIHDDLYVRVLSLGEGNRRLVLCALDLIGFFRQEVLEVTHRVLEQAPGAELIIASVHPHHGPDTMGMWGPDEYTNGRDPLYMAALKDKIVTTILGSLQAMRPAGGIKTTSVHCPGLAKNGRNPEVLDDELTLLQVLDLAGLPMVSLFNFPCHPEVLWEHNPHITADYPGTLRREVEQLSGAPCIFFSADLGGMMTPNVKDHSFAEAELMGKALAKTGLDALEKAQVALEFAISLQKKEIAVKLTNILFKLAMQRGLFPDIRDKKGLIHSEVNLVKIGGLWFATVPGELLPRLGMVLRDELRAAGAAFAGVVGLANDELGYILPVQEFSYPLNPLNTRKHYEESMSVSRKIGAIVVNAIKELVHA
jgi:hypothetical protein